MIETLWNLDMPVNDKVKDEKRRSFLRLWRDVDSIGL
jgi:hypothetical protein